MTALPRSAREYLCAFDVVAVCAYRDGRIGATKDPPADATIWWCAAGSAGCLVRKARTMDGNIPGAARALEIEITPHETVLARCTAAVKRIETGMRWAQRTGALAQFNDEFRRRRLAAHKRGEKFMSYQQARARLRKALAEVAAGKATKVLIAEVFNAP